MYPRKCGTWNKTLHVSFPCKRLGRFLDNFVFVFFRMNSYRMTKKIFFEASFQNKVVPMDDICHCAIFIIVPICRFNSIAFLASKRLSIMSYLATKCFSCSNTKINSPRLPWRLHKWQLNTSFIKSQMLSKESIWYGFN